VPQRLIKVVMAAVVLLATAAHVSAAPAQLFMWRVASATATITLAGSIHVGRSDFFPLPESYEKAFAAASVLAVEVDMSDPAVVRDASVIMMREGLLPGDETLQSRLEPALFARLQGHAVAINFPLAMYSKFKPGLVAMALVMQEYVLQGFDPELGIDKHFLDAAHSANSSSGKELSSIKEVRALETVADQLDIFLSLGDVLDDILIAAVLDDAADIAATVDTLIAYWQCGDADGLDRLLQAEMGDGPEIEDFYRKLVDERNLAMAATIRGWLSDDQDIFVVVGAGHFGGENGLVKLLGCDRVRAGDIIH